MNGLCVVVKPYKTNAIHGVYLVDAEENVDPVDSIKHYCRKIPTVYYPARPWHVDSWHEHADEIEWFVVKDVERLKAIDWPDQSSQPLAKRIAQFEYKVQVYRAFEIKQVTLVQALDALGNELITKATGLGWSPQGLGSALELLANAMEENDQAEAYRESIMDMIEDVTEAVEATESIYEYAAGEFLETTKAPSGPQAPEDMTDKELIEEAIQLYCVISASEDKLRHYALETELFNRDYEIRAGTGYSVQKREEE